VTIHDEIGPWSEVKLDIVREYAAAYSRILSAQPGLHHYYIDAFAGTGQHWSRTTGEFVPGSPLNALLVKPPFEGYHFIDIEAVKVAALEELAGQRGDVHVYHGDCNEILLNRVFPQVRYEDYRRGLCLLDPYGLHLDWQVVEKAGRMRSLEVFINFPVMDINRNVLRKNPESVDSQQRERMTRFWGDERWRSVTYIRERGLFEDVETKTPGNYAVVEAYRVRLREVAGFQYVPEPMAMRAPNGAIIYYLFFASQKPVAQKIVRDIFKKHGGQT
jgi:three-Cys-motif partner protein